MPDFAVATKFLGRDLISKTFRNMGRSASKFGDTASKSFRKASRSGSRFGDVVKGILFADIIKAGAQKIKEGIFSIVSEASKLENAIVDFKILTGSVITANKVVNNLRKTAAATPFEFQQLADATKTLMGFGVVTQKTLIPTIRMLGDTAGGSADRFSRIVFAFSEINANGRATMQEIRQLINAGIPIVKVLREQLNLTADQFREMTKRGEITGPVITKAFQTMTSEGGLFFRGMEEASKTLSGLWSTFIDNVKIAAATLGTIIMPRLKDLVRIGIQLAAFVNKWVQANKQLIQQKFDKTIVKIKDAAIAMIPIIKDLIIVVKFLAPVFKGTFNVIRDTLAGTAKMIRNFLVRVEQMRALASKVKGFFPGGDATPVTPPSPVAPNQAEAQARQQINFQGLLKIAGAPTGSTAEGQTTGAGLVNLELLGAD